MCQSQWRAPWISEICFLQVRPRLMTSFAAGKLQPEFMNAAAWHSYVLIGSFQPQSVANMIWAYATLAHHPPAAFLDVLCRHALQQLASFSPQNISNTIWALATLKHTDLVIVYTVNPRYKDVQCNNISLQGLGTRGRRQCLSL